MLLQLLSDPNTWISLLTLTILEIVLGVDNIIFISILSGKLPQSEQKRARTIGLMLALITRVLLLCSIFWLTKLTAPLFTFLGRDISGKGLVLLAGGLFLLWKSVHEIHGSLEGEDHSESDEKSGEGRPRISVASVIAQIIVIDIVFSLDSVITAVGLVQNVYIMIAAVILAMIVMLIFAGAISDFVNRHPTIKMLALSFLLLVGVVLVADGLGHHIEKGYIYFAMSFSFAVEMLNLKLRKKKKAVQPVHLHQPGRPE
jgi:predicted tellurium resistance membrane protein TerC